MVLWSEIASLPAEKIEKKYYHVKPDGKIFYSDALYYMDLISFEFEANEKGEMSENLMDVVVTCRQTKNNLDIFLEIPFDEKKIAYDTLIKNAFLAEFNIAIIPPKNDSEKDWKKYYKTVDKFSKAHARITNFPHAVWPVTSIIRHLFRTVITENPPTELIVGETVNNSELFKSIYGDARVDNEKYQEITEVVRENVYDVVGGEANFIQMAHNTVRAMEQQKQNR